MRYTCEITIDLPRERVVELFDDPGNLAKWQPGLVSFEPVSGTPGQVGAKSKLRYQMGSRTVDMVETVVSRNLPEEFSGTYEAKNVYNQVSNRFYPEGNGTRWVVDTDFRFSGLMRFVALLMPGAFKKQTRKFLLDFKHFAEHAGH